MDIDEDRVGILPMGDTNSLKEGMIISTTGQVLSIGVGEGYLGRVVDGLGNPIDGLGAIETVDTYPVERKATGVIERKPVHQPLETGIKSIDSMVPIGK
jgi:F-type H+-transporting ATPase subunit alpha